MFYRNVKNKGKTEYLLIKFLYYFTKDYCTYIRIEYNVVVLINFDKQVYNTHCFIQTSSTFGLVINVTLGVWIKYSNNLLNKSINNEIQKNNVVMRKR